MRWKVKGDREQYLVFRIFKQIEYELNEIYSSVKKIISFYLDDM